jgi:hypothetical protein
MTRDGVTNHAQQRLQQRGIPPFVLDLLEEYGSEMRCGGAERLFFDKAARRRLAAHFGRTRDMAAIERWRNVYAAIGDNGRIVTVAHRRRRFRRH